MPRPKLLQLRDCFNPTVMGWPGVVKKTIFGHPGYGVDRSKMFAFSDRAEVVVRLPLEDQPSYLEHPGSRSLAPPGHNKPMGNWVGLGGRHVTDDELCGAVEQAYRALVEG